MAAGQATQFALAGDEALSVHGFLLIIVGQAAWAVGLGLALWRDWTADAS